MNQADKNLREWDNLYKSTSNKIWGDDSIGFLNDFLPKMSTFLGSNSNILDAGTGEGRNLQSLMQLDGRIYAVDGSPNALSKIPDDIRGKIQIDEAHLEVLPYESGYFDAIFGIDIMETLPNISDVIKEFARVLKPNGLLLSNIPSEEDSIYGIDMQHPETDSEAWLYQNKYFYKFYSPEEVQAMFQQFGFKIVEQKRCEWVEKAHPNFRSNEHSHISEVYLFQKQ